ncbi:aminotransferase class I/II-fold pyridoxal phosphate-dependent enzyme [uncultured Tateyamaria sp.]|uniref:aminotransferase class I/II-fold pyridoxal phosphate-dependent enzyme n=1 Tax=uncultured Tateyamaria sp. TaxID=455651 RepID=UPI0026304CE2|nr:aminotransferase class I/II-fold pyridoxal phosphate-dependent enzyme [uncultured Tateyamaria sp.]
MAKPVSPRKIRDFGLEVYFSKWEFNAKHHMTASDFESMPLSGLLALASDEDRVAFENLWLGYTETWGAPALRREIAATYDTMKDENVLCHAGAGEALYAVPRVLLGKDDHVIVPTPNYQGAESIPLSICDVTGVPMDHTPDRNVKGGWRLDIERIKQAIQPNTKLISINFPHNPTGFLLARDDLDALILMCREHGIYLLSDEVYRGVEMDPADQMPQVADLYEKGISLNVMSKAYGLPGLRIGWIASQDTELLQKVERYKHYLSICNSGPSEMLALIALRARDTILTRNRAIVMDNLLSLENTLLEFPGLFEWSRPMGGCVAFPKYLGPDGGEEFCRKLIEESGVLLLPSSIYASDLNEVPADHFRIGIGRDTVFKDGFVAFHEHLNKYYCDYRK